MLIDSVIGICGVYFVGEYENDRNYEYLNVVTYEGSSYTCINEKGCTGKEVYKVKEAKLVLRVKKVKLEK